MKVIKRRHYRIKYTILLSGRLIEENRAIFLTKIIIGIKYLCVAFLLALGLIFII